MKIFLTVVTLAFAVAALIFIPKVMHDDAGTITIIVIDANQETIIHETHTFQEGMTLFDVLSNHYDVVCADINYQKDPSCTYTFGVGSFSLGRVILGIDTVETDFYNHFIKISVNGAQSHHGIDSIALKDGYTYTFEYAIPYGGE